ncbi:MAG: sugar-binding protein [Rhodothermales bacterium]
MQRRSLLILALTLSASTALAQSRSIVPERLLVPFLPTAPSIDGRLDDWKDAAFSDGLWDIARIRHEPWYDEGRRNRLTDHGNNEPGLEDDLSARYYIAWDDTYLYLGAEVHDNVNDIVDPEPADRRWMYKDAICWFIEAPRDEAPEWFGQGDNSFCFVADASKPSYGAWWRHGAAGQTYLEEPIPPAAVNWAVRMNPWGQSAGDFILEARVAMAPTLGASDPRWKPPVIGDEYGLEIVHTDPDGGDYGGHFMIYGTGDDDTTWGRMILSPAQKPIERLPK